MTFENSTAFTHVMPSEQKKNRNVIIYNLYFRRLPTKFYTKSLMSYDKFSFIFVSDFSDICVCAHSYDNPPKRAQRRHKLYSRIFDRQTTRTNTYKLITVIVTPHWILNTDFFFLYTYTIRPCSSALVFFLLLKN